MSGHGLKWLVPAQLVDSKMTTILKLLGSKNPLVAACGIVMIICGLIYGFFVTTDKVNGYVGKFETREEHRLDIEQKVDVFKRDVRIAILENNKILLDELDRRRKN